MRPLIYIELYKEPSFEYTKESVNTLKLLSGFSIIECDNFSDEKTIHLIERLIEEENCILAINNTQPDSQLNLIGKIIRKFQKTDNPLYLINEHPSFSALSKRNRTTTITHSFEEFYKAIDLIT